MDDVYEVFDIQTVAKSCIAGVLLQPNLSDDAGLPLWVPIMILKRLNIFSTYERYCVNDSQILITIKEL